MQATIARCLPLYEGVDWNYISQDVDGESDESPSLRGSGLKSLSARIPCGRGQRLPLYEGVDWNSCSAVAVEAVSSLPLYEGVDWNHSSSIKKAIAGVSLFTREWIEISIPIAKPSSQSPSPSLRGSGLKFFKPQKGMCLDLSPSLRGSGLKFQRQPSRKQMQGSPSLRGSGLKLVCACLYVSSRRLPLYEGVDWNWLWSSQSAERFLVSLFTREWIEIIVVDNPPFSILGLPLYEGVDWNSHGLITNLSLLCLPLYEGVDWNSLAWLKNSNASSLPLYEGVDWNNSATFNKSDIDCLPLYEGVDWNDFCTK